MSGTAGKVALVGSVTPLGGTCPGGASIADFVGYGTGASCFEGSGPTPTLSNTTAAIRVDPGVDTNDNALHFREGAPTPHNVTGIPPSGVGRAMPAAVQSGGSSRLTVSVTPGAAPAAPSVAVTADSVLRSAVRDCRRSTTTARRAATSRRTTAFFRGRPASLAVPGSGRSPPPSPRPSPCPSPCPCRERPRSPSASPSSRSPRCRLPRSRDRR